MKSTSLSNAFCVLEQLENRQLFAAGFPINGIYTDANGDRLTITSTPGSAKNIKVQVVKADQNTGVTQTLVTECTVYFEKMGSGASTIYQADLPVSVGLGTTKITVSPNGDESADANGTLNPPIFTPVDLPESELTPPAPIGKSSSAQAITVPPSSGLQATSVSKNDLLGGVYMGTFRRTTDGQVYKLKVSFSLNKKGHIAMEADFIMPGFGDMIIDTVVHPTHTGTFSVPLGDNALAGTFSAHLSHTGRLVSRLAVPTISIETGSLKKHGS